MLQFLDKQHVDYIRICSLKSLGVKDRWLEMPFSTPIKNNIVTEIRVKYKIIIINYDPQVNDTTPILNTW